MPELFLRDVARIIVPVAAILAVMPFVYDNQLLLLNLVIYLVLAQGLNLSYGFSGYMPFGYVGFFGAGAYGFSILVTHFSVPPLAAILGGGAAAVLMGLILEPLLKLQGAYFGLASLAAAEALHHLIANPSLEWLTGGPYGVNLTIPYAPALTYALAIGIFVLVSAYVAWLRHARFGLRLRAARDNAIAASMAGINIVRERLIVWLVSALAAGLIGAVYAWRATTFFPDAMFDLQFSIFAIVFTLFGGAGTLVGPLIGVFVLYGFYNAIGISTPQYFQLIYGALIMGLVLFLPNGLASLLQRWGINVP
jgi:branched-chain amino acid transport system permease protein